MLESSDQNIQVITSRQQDSNFQPRTFLPGVLTPGTPAPVLVSSRIPTELQSSVGFDTPYRTSTGTAL